MPTAVLCGLVYVSAVGGLGTASLDCVLLPPPSRFSWHLVHWLVAFVGLYDGRLHFMLILLGAFNDLKRKNRETACLENLVAQ